MLVRIAGLLDAAELAEAQALLARAPWVDGRVTAGHQSAQVKDNLQIPEGSPEHRALGGLVLGALERSALFLTAVLPLKVFPPLFNRYDAGMTFGAHVDNAIRLLSGGGGRIRTDVSCTLFLADPESYDGGELIVEDSYGAHSVKLAAGDAVVYPSTSLHRVAPVTRGSRLASFFWIQSMVRDDGQRSLLFDLDMAINRARADLLPGHGSLTELTAVYHNLLRRWADA
ncbi:Fe2+-dependent dioxygenase [Paracraurococcus lichenis]|uniref:Fe2+-dependent dioxygenase n=1 Tax=Paracraurococcus lichenis TaxID=3064888 RepID=A0ABT9E6X9_9PROT|nr:Fe2+-dependent dioxygenase [Paracraurococcus sp. LOR1-02]MDO9711705.1 Fe2+-dependent dioxygenase [Paracraurococcus sp. LOR1-02]